MNDKLDNYIGKVEHLPGTPGLLVRMLAIFRQPDYDLDEIVELMRQDPSLTAEVLRNANSAFYGAETPIVDVFDAITRLGFHQIYQIAVAKLGSKALAMPAGKSHVDVERLWGHSLGAAAATGAVARKVGAHEGLAFTAGLLHDVGKIVLALGEGAAYAAIAAEHPDGGPALQNAETTTFGFGHGEVGSRLLQKWSLPDDIAIPVRHHHDGGAPAPFERLGAIVCLGNLLAHAADDSIPGKYCESVEAVSAMRVLDLSPDDLALLLQAAQVEIKRMSGMVGAAAK